MADNKVDIQIGGSSQGAQSAIERVTKQVSELNKQLVAAEARAASLDKRLRAIQFNQRAINNAAPGSQPIGASGRPIANPQKYAAQAPAYIAQNKENQRINNANIQRLERSILAANNANYPKSSFSTVAPIRRGLRNVGSGIFPGNGFENFVQSNTSPFLMQAANVNRQNRQRAMSQQLIAQRVNQNIAANRSAIANTSAGIGRLSQAEQIYPEYVRSMYASRAASSSYVNRIASSGIRGISAAEANYANNVMGRSMSSQAMRQSILNNAAINRAINQQASSGIAGLSRAESASIIRGNRVPWLANIGMVSANRAVSGIMPNALRNGLTGQIIPNNPRFSGSGRPSASSGNWLHNNQTYQAAQSLNNLLTSGQNPRILQSLGLGGAANRFNSAFNAVDAIPSLIGMGRSAAAIPGLARLGWAGAAAGTAYAGIKGAGWVGRQIPEGIGGFFDNVFKPLQQLSGAAQNLIGSFLMLSGVLYGLNFIGRRVVDTAVGTAYESYEPITEAYKISGLTGSTYDQAVGTQKMFLDAAKATYMPYEGVSKWAFRIMASNPEQFGNPEQAAAFTTFMSQLGAVSGTTNTELQAVMLQLSQAIGNNALMGQEFRSVMLNMPAFAGLLKQYFQQKGVKTPLNELARTRQITAADMIGAAQMGQASVNQRFGMLPMSPDRFASIYKLAQGTAYMNQRGVLEGFASSPYQGQLMSDISTIGTKSALIKMDLLSSMLEGYKYFSDNRSQIGGAGNDLLKGLATVIRSSGPIAGIAATAGAHSLMSVGTMANVSANQALFGTSILDYAKKQGVLPLWRPDSQRNALPRTFTGDVIDSVGSVHPMFGLARASRNASKSMHFGPVGSRIASMYEGDRRQSQILPAVTENMTSALSLHADSMMQAANIAEPFQVGADAVANFMDMVANTSSETPNRLQIITDAAMVMTANVISAGSEIAYAFAQIANNMVMSMTMAADTISLVFSKVGTDAANFFGNMASAADNLPFGLGKNAAASFRQGQKAASSFVSTLPGQVSANQIGYGPLTAKQERYNDWVDTMELTGRGSALNRVGPKVINPTVTESMKPITDMLNAVKPISVQDASNNGLVKAVGGFIGSSVHHATQRRDRVGGGSVPNLMNPKDSDNLEKIKGNTGRGADKMDQMVKLLNDYLREGGLRDVYRYGRATVNHNRYEDDMDGFRSQGYRLDRERRGSINYVYGEGFAY